MKNVLIFLSLLLCFSPFTACDDGPKDTVVTITTEFGDMVAILYDQTPVHKANFIKLAKEHYFDGTLFHRVIKDFVIQGGDPDSKNIKPGEKLGDGGPGYKLPPEFNAQLFHEKGALSAARFPDEFNPKKESSGSQFFIVQGVRMHPDEVAKLVCNRHRLQDALRKVMQDPSEKPLIDSLKSWESNLDEDTFRDKLFRLVPRLEKLTGIAIRQELSQEKMEAYTQLGGVSFYDGEYTVFGKVIKGLDIIDKIAAVSTEPGTDRPLEDIPMKITVAEVSKKKITRIYGYTYPNQP